MQNGEWRMGNGEWGMGNAEWGMGNGEWTVVRIQDQLVFGISSGLEAPETHGLEGHATGDRLASPSTTALKALEHSKH